MARKDFWRRVNYNVRRYKRNTRSNPRNQLDGNLNSLGRNVRPVGDRNDSGLVVYLRTYNGLSVNTPGPHTISFQNSFLGGNPNWATVSSNFEQVKVLKQTVRIFPQSFPYVLGTYIGGYVISAYHGLLSTAPSNFQNVCDLLEARFFNWNDRMIRVTWKPRDGDPEEDRYWPVGSVGSLQGGFWAATETFGGAITGLPILTYVVTFKISLKTGVGML